MADLARERAEWLGLSCVECGHWKKGQFTKEQVAEWLRAHGPAQIRKNDVRVTCASVCPHPCDCECAECVDSDRELFGRVSDRLERPLRPEYV